MVGEPPHHLKVLALTTHKPLEIRNKVSFLVKCERCWFNHGADQNHKGSNTCPFFCLADRRLQTLCNHPFLHHSESPVAVSGSPLHPFISPSVRTVSAGDRV